MADFSYKAVDSSGSAVAGSIEAIDRKAAVSALTEKGRFVTDIIEKSAAFSASKSISGLTKGFQFGGSRVSSKEVLAMTTQLSTALNAGLPLYNAIEIIGAQQHKQGMIELTTSLAQEVSSGSSFSEALAKHPKIFSRLYVSMVRVGEMGGILEKTMVQLSELLTRDEKIKNNMKSALAYPTFVLTLGLGSVIIIVAFIVPQIISTLGEGVALPLPTQLLMQMSHMTVKYGWMMAIAIVMAAIFFNKWKNTDAGLLSWDTFLLKVPILGKVLRTISVGRFARTLGALTSSGITILEALSVVRDTMGNEKLGSLLDVVADKVKVGHSLAEPLGESGDFPPLLTQIVSIGEQTGRLDELLLNAADTFDGEADSAITRFMAIFPALLILVLAVIIGFIIIATLLPILNMDLGGIGM
ncbi:MAG: type II secretion system F family protein [Planctomycetes bacterium]|nr:type II secretion system F family protein [Planctomycetota bacterium]